MTKHAGITDNIYSIIMVVELELVDGTVVRLINGDAVGDFGAFGPLVDAFGAFVLSNLASAGDGMQISIACEKRQRSIAFLVNPNMVKKNFV